MEFQRKSNALHRISIENPHFKSPKSPTLYKKIKKIMDFQQESLVGNPSFLLFETFFMGKVKKIRKFEKK